MKKENQIHFRLSYINIILLIHFFVKNLLRKILNYFIKEGGNCYLLLLGHRTIAISNFILYAREILIQYLL